MNFLEIRVLSEVTRVGDLTGKTLVSFPSRLSHASFIATVLLCEGRLFHLSGAAQKPTRGRAASGIRKGVGMSGKVTAFK